MGPALCPPDGWDELVYHAAIPARRYRDGWPLVYQDLPYSGFPSLGESLFWILTPLEQTIVPRLLTWSAWAIGILALHTSLRSFLRGLPAITIVLWLVQSSSMLLVSQNCYVESLQIMDVACIILVMGKRLSHSDSWQKALMLGILGGGSASVKLTGFSVILFPYMVLLIHSLPVGNSKEIRAKVSFFVVMLIGNLLLIIPFYLRPILQTGNPLYPFFASWFTSDSNMILSSSTVLSPTPMALSHG